MVKKILFNQLEEIEVNQKIQQEIPKDYQENLIYHNYITNQTIWIVDQTFIGKYGSILSVANLFTRAFVGYAIISSDTALCVDDYIELFNEIIEDNLDENLAIPKIIHGDNAPIHHSNRLLNFLNEKNIKFSYSTKLKFGNQVIESLQNVLKYFILSRFFNDYTKEAHTFMESFNIKDNRTSPIQRQTVASRSKNKKVRQHFFNNLFISQPQFWYLVHHAFEDFNSRPCQFYEKLNNKWKISKRQLEFLTDKDLQPKTLEITSSKQDKAKIILKQNEKILEKQIQIKKNQEFLAKPEKPLEQLSIQELTEVVRLATQPGFDKNHTYIAQASMFLKNQYDQILEKNSKLLETNQVLANEVYELKEQVKIFNDREEQKLFRREKRLNRERRRKRNAISDEHYLYSLMVVGTNKTFTACRKRVALCFLFVSGLRVSELLGITKDQVLSLLHKGRIGVDRVKRGEKMKPLLLTKKGLQFFKDRSEDIHIVNSQSNPNNQYFFAGQKSSKPLARETITREINQILSKVQEQFPLLYFRSHSFRSGVITSLWKQGFEIKLLSAYIGHRSITTTAAYIEEPSFQDIEETFKQIDTKSSHSGNTIDIDIEN